VVGERSLGEIIASAASIYQSFLASMYIDYSYDYIRTSVLSFRILKLLPRLSHGRF
jgi:hypothetical protein